MGTAVVRMEVVVRGRNVEVPDHFRQHVADKLIRVERYDSKIIRTDVELHHERNRRQNDSCQHVEITCRTRGPVVRSEACASDFYRALDIAMEKLERRLRQAADRRRVHYGRRTHPAKPMTVDQALFEMELVGHDFYLFADQDTGRPSVVYRRRAYDYGLIRLTG